MVNILTLDMRRKQHKDKNKQVNPQPKCIIIYTLKEKINHRNSDYSLQHRKIHYFPLCVLYPCHGTSYKLMCALRNLIRLKQNQLQCHFKSQKFCCSLLSPTPQAHSCRGLHEISVLRSVQSLFCFFLCCLCGMHEISVKGQIFLINIKSTFFCKLISV